LSSGFVLRLTQILESSPFSRQNGLVFDAQKTQKPFSDPFAGTLFVCRLCFSRVCTYLAAALAAAAAKRTGGPPSVQA